MDLRELFTAAESFLLNYGSQHRPTLEIRKILDEFKTYESRRSSDDDFFRMLTAIVFYSGFRAATVSAKLHEIYRHFPNWRSVASYAPADVEQILADPRMIRHPGKIRGVVRNAQEFGRLIGSFASFGAYIESFHPRDSTGNLFRLRDDLRKRFAYLGGITVYHFLTDIGLPVLKPDRVISRMFFRLGLTDDESDLVGTIAAGQQLATATGFPIRYIDIVFVALGQVQSEALGIDRGICLKQPRCEVCGLKQYCRFYQQSHP
jgi:DNA-3-methyladenine glycosylase I